MNSTHPAHTVGHTAPSSPALLPAGALAGRRVGISVSDSADLPRLGLLPAHFKLALRELARTVLVGGGALAYGGHLLTDGAANYTEFLIGELHRYAPSQSPGAATPALQVCLAWHEHRHCSIDTLDATDAQLGLHGQLQCLDLQGRVLADPRTGRAREGQPYPAEASVRAQALTALRHHLTAATSARALLGGKRHGYAGAMPGLVEEALLALRAGQPLYLAAGFGGVVLDMAARLDPRCAALCPRHASDPPPLEATTAALDEWAGLVGGAGWRCLNNALSDDENLRLATTHRPAELAALVALGLGRWAGQGGGAR